MSSSKRLWPAGLICLLCWGIPDSGLAQKLRCEEKFRLPQGLSEASGLSLLGSDTLAWINDSGNAPLIWYTDRQGNLLGKDSVPSAKNKDWEALAQDQAGHFFLADIGNNRSKRKDLLIYKWRPGAESAEEIRFHYPQQPLPAPPGPASSFDSESLLWHRGSLYLFIKNAPSAHQGLASWYRIPDRAGIYAAEKMGEIPFRGRVVTDVAISPDGQEIAWVAYRFRKWLGFIPSMRSSVFLLPLQELWNTEVAAPRRLNIKGWKSLCQYEAISYLDRDHLLLGNERTPLNKAALRVFRIRR